MRCFGVRTVVMAFIVGCSLGYTFARLDLLPLRKRSSGLICALSKAELVTSALFGTNALQNGMTSIRKKDNQEVYWFRLSGVQTGHGVTNVIVGVDVENDRATVWNYAPGDSDYESFNLFEVEPHKSKCGVSCENLPPSALHMECK